MGATYFKNALSASRECLDIDWDDLEDTWKLREDEAMANVVIVRDLANIMKQDRSHMSRKIRLAGIATVEVRDKVSGQMVKAIDAESVPAVQALYEETTHTIVSAQGLL